MAEKKRNTLTQRIGMGVFLGILGVGVGLGVYDGFDAKKEKTPVVRDVEVKEKTVHNKGKNDPPSTLVEAVHKDKNGRVLIRVRAENREKAERILRKEIAKSAERDREVGELYEKDVATAKKNVGRVDGGNITESESYKLLENAVSKMFSYRFGDKKKDVLVMLSDYDAYEDGLTFTRNLGTFDVKITLTLTKDERLEGYSIRVSSDDVPVLKSSLVKLRTLVESIKVGEREYVGIGVRGLEEKRAYTIFSTGK